MILLICDVLFEVAMRVRGSPDGGLLVAVWRCYCGDSALGRR